MIELTHDGIIGSILAFLFGLVGYHYRKQNNRLEELEHALPTKLDADQTRIIIGDKLDPINVHIEEIKDDIKEIKVKLK